MDPFSCLAGVEFWLILHDLGISWVFFDSVAFRYLSLPYFCLSFIMLEVGVTHYVSTLDSKQSSFFANVVQETQIKQENTLRSSKAIDPTLCFLLALLVFHEDLFIVLPMTTRSAGKPAAASRRRQRNRSIKSRTLRTTGGSYAGLGGQ